MKYLLLLFVLISASVIYFMSHRGSNNSPLIEAYAPSDFKTVLSRPYFYLKDGVLSYGREIDSDRESLLSGEIRNVVVSPDNEKALVATNNELWLVHKNRQTVKIGDLYMPYDRDVVFDTYFYVGNIIQWSADSKYVYLIKDLIEEPSVFKLFSDRSQLVSYKISDGQIEHVISPYRGAYFFQENDGIVYSAADKHGNVNLYRYNREKKISEFISEEFVARIPINPSLSCTVYYDFNEARHREYLMLKSGVSLSSKENGIWSLAHKDHQLFSIQEGIGIKGAWNGISLARGTSMLSENLLLFPITSTSFTGTLLVETENYTYKEMSMDFRVYQHVNTCDVQDWRIDSSGIVLSEKAM